MNSTVTSEPRTSSMSSSAGTRQHGDGPYGKDQGGTPEAVAHSEGVVARTIEQQTAKLPSDVFLWAALGSMGISLGLHLAGKRADGLFVGQWAAPFLLMGVYNKIVKVEGSDRIHR